MYKSFQNFCYKIYCLWVQSLYSQLIVISFLFLTWRYGMLNHFYVEIAKMVTLNSLSSSIALCLTPPSCTICLPIPCWTWCKVELLALDGQRSDNCGHSHFVRDWAARWVPIQWVQTEERAQTQRKQRVPVKSGEKLLTIKTQLNFYLAAKWINFVLNL